MSETTNNNLNNTEKKQYDWFAQLIANPTLDYVDFSNHGINAETTQFLSKEEYEKKPKVQSIFKKDDGTFDQDRFDSFYNYALNSYNKLVDNSWTNQDHIGIKRITPELRKTAAHPEDYDLVESNTQLTFIQNPFSEPGQSYGLYGVNQMSPKRMSDREVAQTQEIYNKKTGKFEQRTPNDMWATGMSIPLISGLAYAVTEPLVLAEYTEDTTEYDPDSGQYVEHKKGELKRKNGKPYYETLLDGESAIGRKPLHVTDVLSKDGSWWNKIDVFDSDGIDKSVIGATSRLIVDLSLLLNKRTRNGVVIPHAAMTLADSFAGLTRAVTDATTDVTNGNNKTYNASTHVQNFVTKFDTSFSDTGQQSPWSLEMWTNMIAEIPLQLYEQRAIAQMFTGNIQQVNKARKATRVLNAEYKTKFGRNLADDFAKNQINPAFNRRFADVKAALETKSVMGTSKFGAGISKGYMALMQANEVNRTMEENNIDGYTRLLGTVASLAAYGYLFSTEYGDVALRGLGINETKQLGQRFGKELIEDLAKKNSSFIVKSQTPLTSNKFLLGRWFGKAKDLYSNAMSKPVVADALREGGEEVFEEVISDSVIGISRKIRDAVSGAPDVKDTWNWTPEDAVTRYLMSFIGGGIGGSFFHVVNSVSAKLNGTPNLMSEDTYKSLLYAITNGKTEDIIRGLDNMLEKHKTGLSESLSFEVESYDRDNNPVFKAVNKEDQQSKSQAYQVIEYAKDLVRAFDAQINQDGYKIPNDKLYLSAVAKNNKMMQLITSGVHLDIIYEFQDQLFEFYQKKGKYNKLSEEQQKGFAGQKLLGEIKLAKDNLDNILNGNNADLYARKMLFYLNPQINQPFMDANVNMFANSLGLNLTGENRQAIISEYQKTYDLEAKNPSVYGGNIGVQYTGKTSTFWKNMAWSLFDKIYQNTKDKVQLMPNNEGMNDAFQAMRLTQEVLSEFKQDPNWNLTEEEKEKIVNNILTKIDLKREQILDQINPEWKQMSKEDQNRIVNSFIDAMTQGGLSQEFMVEAVKKQYERSARNEQTNVSNTRTGLNQAISMRSFAELKAIYDKLTSAFADKGLQYIDQTTYDIIHSMYNAANDPDVVQTIIDYILSLSPEQQFDFLAEVMDERGRTEFGFYSETDGVIYQWYYDDPETYERVEVTKENIDRSLELMVKNYLFNNRISDLASAVHDSRFLDNLIKKIYSEEQLAFLDEMPTWDIFSKETVSPMRTIYDTLNEFSSELAENEGKIFDLLRDNSQLFENGTFRGFHVLTDAMVSDLENARFVLNMFRSVMLSLSLQDDFGFDGKNDFLQSIQQAEKNKGLNTDKITQGISYEQSAVLSQDLQMVQEKIDFVLQLNAINNQSKISKSMETRHRIEFNDILLLLGKSNSSSWNKRLQQVIVDGNKIFDFSDILSQAQVSEIDSMNNDNVFFSGDEAAVKSIENISYKLKHALFERTNGLSVEQKKSVLKQLIQAVDGNKLNFANNVPQFINENTTVKDCQDTFLLQNLMSWMSYDIYAFNNDIEEFAKANNRKTPFYDQMISIYNGVAKSEPGSLDSLLRDILQEDINTSREKQQDGEYIPTSDAQQWNAIRNVYAVFGDGGSGKTQVVLNGIYSINKKRGRAERVLVSSITPKTTQRIGEVLGVESDKVMTRQELMASIFVDGIIPEELTDKKIVQLIQDKVKDPKADGLLSSPSSIDLAKIRDKIKNNGDLPTEVYIDELTGFLVTDVQLLSDLGIKVYMSGDRKQPGVSINGISAYPNGFIAFSPELICNIRANNSLQFENTNTSAEILRVACNKLVSRDKNTKQYIEQSIKKVQFKYSETKDESGIRIFGSKLVSSIDDEYIEGLVKTLSDKEQVCIVSDDPNSFRDLQNKYGDKIVVVNQNDIQGDEYQYVVVTQEQDVEVYSDASLVNAMKFANMLLSRAKDGIVFVGKKTLGPYQDAKFKEVSKAFPMELSESSLSDYNALFLRLINKTPDSSTETNKVQVESQPVTVTLDPVQGKTNEEINKLIESTVPCYPFYRHLGYTIKDGELKRSQTNEDLSIIDGTVDDLESNKKTLGVLRAFAFMKLSGQSIDKVNFSNVIFESEQNVNPDKYLRNAILNLLGVDVDNDPNDLVENLYNKLNNGKLVLKFQRYDDAHKNYGFNLQGYQQQKQDLFISVVYQIQEGDKTYDITLGVTSQYNGIQEKLNLPEQTQFYDALNDNNGVIYFDIDNPGSLNMEAINVVREDKLDAEELSNMTIQEFRELYPELKISNVYLPSSGNEIGALERTAQTTKGQPVVFVSYDIFSGKDPQELFYQSKTSPTKTSQVLYVNQIGHTMQELVKMSLDQHGNINRMWLFKTLPDMLPSRLVSAIWKYVQDKTEEDQTCKAINDKFLELFTNPDFSKKVLSLSMKPDNIKYTIGSLQGNSFFSNIIKLSQDDLSAFNKVWNDFIEIVESNTQPNTTARVSAILNEIKDPNNTNANIVGIRKSISEFIQNNASVLDPNYNVDKFCTDIQNGLDTIQSALSAQFKTGTKAEQESAEFLASQITASLLQSGDIFEINKKATVLQVIFEMYNNGTGLNESVQTDEVRRIIDEAIEESGLFPDGIYIQKRGDDAPEVQGMTRLYNTYDSEDYFYPSAYLQLPRFFINKASFKQRTTVAVGTQVSVQPTQPKTEQNALKIEDVATKELIDAFDLKRNIDVTSVSNSDDLKTKIIEYLNQKPELMLRYEQNHFTLLKCTNNGDKLTLNEEYINFTIQDVDLSEAKITINKDKSDLISGDISLFIDVQGQIYNVTIANTDDGYKPSYSKVVNKALLINSIKIDLSNIINKLQDDAVKTELQEKVNNGDVVQLLEVANDLSQREDTEEDDLIKLDEIIQKLNNCN